MENFVANNKKNPVYLSFRTSQILISYGSLGPGKIFNLRITPQKLDSVYVSTSERRVQGKVKLVQGSQSEDTENKKQDAKMKCVCAF